MRNKRLILSLLTIICCLASIILINYKISTSIFSFQKENKVILIDPGHGGIDGGAVSKRGTVEKNLNLQISKKVKTALTNLGYQVIMTREDDSGLYENSGTIRNKKIQDLNNRIKMINSSGANIFISIHMNMFPESKYYGAQVWYSDKYESKVLAHMIQSGLKTDINNGNKRDEKAANNSYKILRESEIVSVLIECGFLSNYNEEQQLLNEEYQNKIAISIAASVDKFYNAN